jgi:hypothetical protein
MSQPKHTRPLCIPRSPPTVNPYTLCLRTLSHPPLRLHEEDWPLIEHIRQHGQLGSGSMVAIDYFFDRLEREDRSPPTLDNNAGERAVALEELRKREESRAEFLNLPEQIAKRAAAKRLRELQRIREQKELERERKRHKRMMEKRRKQREQQDAEWRAAEERERQAAAQREQQARAAAPFRAFDPDRGPWPRPPIRGQAYFVENNFFAYEGDEQHLISSYPQWHFEQRGVRDGIVWLEVTGAQLSWVFTQ